MEQARAFLRKVIKIIKKPEMRILPGQLAFFLFMSLIPLAALIGAIASSLSIPVAALRQTMNGMPKEVIDFIIEIINSKGINFNISVFFISAFILASNGPHSMIITSNEIYKIESRNIIARRIKAIMMTFVMVGLFFVLFLIPIFGDTIFEMVRNNIRDESLVKFIYITYQLIFNIKLLYVIAPDDHIESMTTTQGAIFTTIGWIIATEIYSFYIGSFTSYDKFYGSISNIIILLLWIYILSYIFVLGMIINAGTYKEKTQVLKVVEDE